MALKVNKEILKTIQYATGNQCRAHSNGVILKVTRYFQHGPPGESYASVVGCSG